MKGLIATMRTMLVCILLALALPAWAVDYIFAGFAVETNGFVLRMTNWTAHNLVAENPANTNVGFFTGFLSNNVPSATNGLEITLTRMAFNDAGEGTVVQKTIYGTQILKRPYPMQNTNDCMPSDASNCVVRLALSERIFRRDSNITVRVAYGALRTTNGPYGASDTNFMGTNWTGFVDNASTNEYFVPVCAWSEPGFQRISNDTYRLRCVAYHYSAQEGRPVRAVKFWGIDAAGNMRSNWVTSPTIDRSKGESPPIVEYVADVDATAYTDLAVVTNNFVAYPWEGDRTFDTAWTNCFGTNKAGRYEEVSPSYWLNDRLGNYRKSVAVVDPVFGTANGVVVSNAAFNPTAPPATFSDTALAANALIRSNHIWSGGSQSNLSAGTLYLTNGIYAFGGSTTCLRTQPPEVWFTIAAYPGLDRSGVLITNTGSDQDLGERVKISSCTVTSHVASTFSQMDGIWFDNCDIATYSANCIYYSTNIWFTRSKLRKLVIGSNTSPGEPKYRACEFAFEATSSVNTHLMLGCWKTNTGIEVGWQNSAVNQVEFPGNQCKPATIWAYNKFLCLTNPAGSVMDWACNEALWNRLGDWVGSAFVQNVWEQVRDNSTAMGIAGTGVATNWQNCLIWCNTTAGQKINGFYNWNAVPEPRFYSSSIKGNLFEEWNIKDGTVAGATSSSNVNNWSVLYGVGNDGNILPEIEGIGAAGSFMFNYPGLRTWQQAATPGSTNVWARFVDRKARSHTNDFGGGNYRLQSVSPAFIVTSPWVLPYDLEGIPRGAMDPPGAYVSGNVRKGAFF